MEQNNQLATPAPKLVLPATTAELTPAQRGWLTLGHLKGTTFEGLQKHELAAQALFAEATTTNDLTVVQTKLKALRDTHGEMEQQRKVLTRLLDEKIYAPSMEFEKRVKAAVEGVAAHELNLRKAAEAEANKMRDYNQELVQLETHIRNEYVRIAHRYKHDLLTNINAAYSSCLTARTATKEVPMAMFRDTLKSITLSQFVKFQRRLVDDAKATELFKKIPKPDFGAMLEEALAGLEEKFVMYEHDLQNAEAALKGAEEMLEVELNKMVEEVQVEAATNLLVAQAGTYTVENKATTVKRKKAVIVQNDDKWAIAVIAAFMTNLAHVKKHIKVTAWEKLSIGQMAKALAALHNETGVELANLQLEDVEK